MIRNLYLGVPKIGGFPPKSSIFIGFSIIFTIHFGVYTPILGSTPISTNTHGLLDSSVLATVFRAGFVLTARSFNGKDWVPQRRRIEKPYDVRWSLSIWRDWGFLLSLESFWHRIYVSVTERTPSTNQKLHTSFIKFLCFGWVKMGFSDFPLQRYAFQLFSSWVFSLVMIISEILGYSSSSRKKRLTPDVTSWV